MYRGKKISLVIPAKGTSNRLKRKNLLKLGNKSLVFLVCEKCLKSEIIDNIYVDTECDVILEDVSPLIQKGLKIVKRPFELANNQTSGNDLVKFEMSQIEKVDIFLHTYCTSPFITIETIDRCVKKFIDNEHKESFLSVIKLHEYIWKTDKKNTPINFCPKKLPNSNDLNHYWKETHGIYGIKWETSEKLGYTRISENPMLIEIPDHESLDINYEIDYKLAEVLWKKKQF